MGSMGYTLGIKFIEEEGGFLVDVQNKQIRG